MIRLDLPILTPDRPMRECVVLLAEKARPRVRRGSAGRQSTLAAW